MNDLWLEEEKAIAAASENEKLKAKVEPEGKTYKIYKITI